MYPKRHEIYIFAAPIQVTTCSDLCGLSVEDSHLSSVSKVSLF